MHQPNHFKPCVNNIKFIIEAQSILCALKCTCQAMKSESARKEPFNISADFPVRDVSKPVQSHERCSHMSKFGADAKLFITQYIAHRKSRISFGGRKKFAQS